ncbi:hypothetical protein RRG08_011542 [Elysia crispata]|uniref:EF-hand domain-containing protein n=1 Tax=Elysia crispata TaxID=231223 RepID=A0AAE1APP0_9GAST|nr:hypothetical protein RRG08_011542 [Elysia crispata]
MDKDKDFKVSRDEFNKAVGKLPKGSRREMALLRDFQRIDKDKSGSLSREELMESMHARNTSLRKDTIEKIFEETWKDDDTEIQYDEFLRLLNFQESESVLKQLFTKLDKDGSGELSVEEMREALNLEGEIARLRPQILKLLDEQAKDFLGKKIDFHKFVSIWLQQKETVRKTPTASNPYV